MRAAVRRLGLAAIPALGWCAPVAAQVTQRVSVATDGTQGNASSGAWREPSISADGRYVSFQSYASNLVPGDTNSVGDVFVRDRATGTTERVSIGPGGAQANGVSWLPSISGDGRYVAFSSAAANLVPGDTNGFMDVFVRDRQTGTTVRASVGSSGVEGDGASDEASFSRDGRFVAFSSEATNLVPGDQNLNGDVFVRDLVGQVTTRASVDSAGTEGNWWSFLPAISADGRHVAFISLSSNLVPGDTGVSFDVFLRDRVAGTTELISVPSAGGHANGDSIGERLSISADGRFVAFGSWATNLVPGDADQMFDVFLRDRAAGTTERVSQDAAGGELPGDSELGAVSDDGRYVAFRSTAWNLVPGDTNGYADVFVRDRQSGTTTRESLSSTGAQSADGSQPPVMTPDGRFVAFAGDGPDLVPGDTNTWRDVFVRDRFASGFTSLCDPGVGGVIACPCGNPPSGPGRGCDNSAATGGAILAASGAAYIASDSLVFTTSGERASALSILGQWRNPNATGSVLGMGVRCTSSGFERLYVRQATGGSITVPDFAAGDASVSARSAAEGDTIVGGESRWYVVYYRDPHVLGGCSPTSTLNATQTGRVTWWP